MFKFTPKTDQELDMVGLIPEGEYPFIIQQSEEKQSEAGNTMIVLFLEVYRPDGSSCFIGDFLVCHEKMAWKIKHFCNSTNIIQQYNNGNIDPNSLLQLEGHALIGIEKKAGKRTKNVVKDYLVKKDIPKEPLPSTPNITEESKDSDEDIPF